MIVIPRKINGAKTAKIGRVVFHDNKMYFFAGYHTCPDGSVHKVLMNTDELRELSKKYGGDTNLRKNIARWFVRHYDL